jgi:GDP-L-fucose synthase
LKNKYQYNLKGKKIFVTGHQGMLGSSICRNLEEKNVEVLSISRDKLDLTRQSDVENWVKANRPDAIIVAAAKVGGIYANDNYPAEFIYQNLAIEQNLIHAAHLYEVERLVMLGSSCSYPKTAPQPIIESSLMDGKPEPTNQWYTVAKIAGIKLCEAYRKQYNHDFISIIPANLFGPGDSFDPINSHVIPGLIRRLHESKISKKSNEVIWGSGMQKREFMYVDDASDAIIFLMEHYSDIDIINVGTGKELTIRQLSEKIADIVDYQGELIYDTTKTDGAPRKILDVARLHAMNWNHSSDFDDSLDLTYQWFCKESFSKINFKN